ncbi:methyltransferase domain-containing protein [Aurantibacter crassamenti]|uniref:methyltransferase domain-containing protein n=1 Tax=Aurantibacter crassamenti TaxID=1837375 RepID=UPI001EEE95EE|nr:methyltransferase domain-containing protein [Aurantibacter crassamenti]
MDFSKRHREIELMDDIHISIDDLQATYHDINSANRLLGGDSDVLQALKKMILENPKQQYSIIDVGCGDGAMLRSIAVMFRKLDISVELLGVDLNAKAIDLAREASIAFPEIEFKVQDALKMDGVKADFVISTLTMHHIDEANISHFLKGLTKIASIGIVISDLQRSRFAYYLFQLFSVIFIKTEIAKNDGLVSIRSGFLKKELRTYSMVLPAYQHSIEWKWAFRYLWVMRLKS